MGRVAVGTFVGAGIGIALLVDADAPLFAWLLALVAAVAALSVAWVTWKRSERRSRRAPPLPYPARPPSHPAEPAAEPGGTDDRTVVAPEAAPAPGPAATREERSSAAPAAQATRLEPREAAAVHFSVSAPATVLAGESLVVRAWLHLEEQRLQMLARLRMAVGRDEQRVESAGPYPVPWGTEVLVRLEIEGSEIRAPERRVLWTGEICCATFRVRAGRNGRRAGTATFFVEGAPVEWLDFDLHVGAGAEAGEAGGRAVGESPVPTRRRPCRSAFASYASEDRGEVLKRVQGMQKVVPDLDVFVDAVSLRSGEKWTERLVAEIGSRDVFYLFWSRAARRSAWVEREWRTALALRGLDYIDPVPLAPPEEAPPPAELAERLHFNDWMLAYLRGQPVAA